MTWSFIQLFTCYLPKPPLPKFYGWGSFLPVLRIHIEEILAFIKIRKSTTHWFLLCGIVATVKVQIYFWKMKIIFPSFIYEYIIYIFDNVKT